MDRKNNISSFSIIIAFIALALCGCAMLPLLPVKLSPSHDLPAIEVNFDMIGSDPRTIESEVTSRIESVMARISGVKKLRSRSWFGGGRVIIEFNKNADMETARFETAMMIRRIWGNLPENAGYPQITMRKADDMATRPFMTYTVNSNNSPAEIKRYTELNIAPLISNFSGVASVKVSGAEPMEWLVVYDVDKIRSLEISESIISSALASYFGSEFLGIARLDDDPGGEYIRVAVSSNHHEFNPEEIVVAHKGGKLVTLDELAVVKLHEASTKGYFRINGLNSVYISITASPDVNQIELGTKVQQALQSVNLSDGYSLHPVYDSSQQIEKELNNIYLRTALTLLILLLFVGVMTLSWRYLALITISLSINMAIAVVAYYLLGVEIQLYSLAGITISFNLVIDNIIVMTEHLLRHRNLRAFPAILAATLTTLGAISVIFFLDEKIMLSLKDFVVVVMVNLMVSLAVALMLVPALAERMKLQRRHRAVRRSKLMTVTLLHGYRMCVSFVCRFRIVVCILFFVAFAGSLYLFEDKVKEGTYFNRADVEPVLDIYATMPNGATLSQMNAMVMEMERFLSEKDGISQFQTSVTSSRRAVITVFFRSELWQSGYPFKLKGEVVSKALSLGGGSWSVYGLEDVGFSNNVSETAGSYKVKLRGFNYDELFAQALKLRDSLMSNKRVRDVNLSADFTFFKDDYSEYYLDIDRERLIKDSLTITDLFGALRNEIGRDIPAGSLSSSEGFQNIRLTSSAKGRDIWGVMNIPVMCNGGKIVKLSDYATISLRQTPGEVVKENQEYILCLQYEYIGTNTQGERMLKRTIEKFRKKMPMGYHVESDNLTPDFGDDAHQYWLLFLVGLIIFFISAILLNSLRQPLAIVLVIPVSFVGLFLTFYLFDLKFDQGGFAAFVLLSGITVNAAIYIINEYNSLRGKYRNVHPVKIYVKAFGFKITSVILTVISTVLGFVPFIVGTSHEGFWFPLAAGVMGGLVMSLVAIFFLLPVLILPTPKKSNCLSAREK